MKAIYTSRRKSKARKEKDEERKKTIRSWINIGIQGALTLFTIGLFLVATYEANEAKKNTSLVEQNFRIENRAWVGLTSPPEHQGGIIGLMRGQTYSIDIRNFGKTPAESLRYYRRFFFF